MKTENSDKKRDLEEEIAELRKTIVMLQETVEDLSSQLRRSPSQPTGPKDEVLEILKERGEPMSIKEIAEEMDLAETTVSGYTLDLYRSGLLERSRRLVAVSPTRRVRKLEYYVPGKKKKKWHYVD